MLSACCCCYLLFGVLGCAPSNIKTQFWKSRMICTCENECGLTQNPGKCSYPLPRRKQLWVPTTRSILLGSRPDLDQSPDGLSLRKPFDFAQTSRVRREWSKTDGKITIITLHRSRSWASHGAAIAVAWLCRAQLEVLGCDFFTRCSIMHQPTNGKPAFLLLFFCPRYFEVYGHCSEKIQKRPYLVWK